MLVDLVRPSVMGPNPVAHHVKRVKCRARIRQYEGLEVLEERKPCKEVSMQAYAHNSHVGRITFLIWRLG